MDCKNCKNYCPNEPTHLQFHVDRIVRILESGTNIVTLPRNQDDKLPVHLSNSEDKIKWITSSLLELGIIENYSGETHPEIEKLVWKTFYKNKGDRFW